MARFFFHLGGLDTLSCSSMKEIALSCKNRFFFHFEENLNIKGTFAPFNLDNTNKEVR